MVGGEVKKSTFFRPTDTGSNSNPALPLFFKQQCMANTLLSTSQFFIHLSQQQTTKVGSVSISHFTIGETESLSGHILLRWRSYDSNPGSLALTSELWILPHS